jgi:hypothetical protein
MTDRKMTPLEREDRFDAELAQAKSATDADRRLAAMLADSATDRWHRVSIAAELGDIPRGPTGTAALRSTYKAATENSASSSADAKAASCDLICACVIALAKREGPAATDVYAAAASSATATIREYGMSALAPVGDDRAWGQVMSRLDEMLGRQISPRGLRWREACLAVEYLARHAPQGSERATQLITLIRDRWRNLGDQDLIDRWWPGIGPGGHLITAIDLVGAHTPRGWWQPKSRAPRHGDLG